MAHRIGSYIGRHLNQKERRVLYCLIDDVEEELPWNRADSDGAALIRNHIVRVEVRSDRLII